MNGTDEMAELPTAGDLRRQLTRLADEITNLSAPGLGKVTAKIRDQPVALALVALGIGVIGGYLLKR